MFCQEMTLQTITREFLLPDTVCAIAADEKSYETIWFVYVIAVEIADTVKSDSFGHKIPPGHMYVKGNYLERSSETNKGQHFKLMKKEVFLFKESIVYPYVKLGKEEKWILHLKILFL